MNSKLEEYLNYYIGLPSSPGFAVMLNGEWGSGKTWFIDEYINKNKSVNFLRISLYGISSLSDIDAQIFQQLHPVLSSKPMMLTGKFLKGAVKFGLKVDIDGDGSKETSINLQAIEDNFSKDAINKYIVVFDDLERSQMSQSATMGYINSLVEQQGMKSIILSDESKILDEKYASIKEKTIGISLQVKHDLDRVYDAFLEKIIDKKAKTVLETNKQTVFEVFNTAGYRNLRHLSQTLFSFEFFVNVLEERCFEISELMQELTKQYFIFSIEVKNDNNLVTELINISDTLADAALKVYFKDREKETEGTEEESLVSQIVNKHNLGYTTILLDDLWSDILGKGEFDKEKVNISLQSSQFMVDESSPAWKRLWYFRNLEDAEFDTVSKEVLDAFSNQEYKNVGVVFHVFAMLLSFSRKKLHQESIQSVFDKCKRYIKEMFALDAFLEEEVEYLINSHDFGWHGLGYFDEESTEFIELRKYFAECAEQKSQEKMIENTKNIIAYIENSEIENIRRLFFDHEKQTSITNYQFKPIFQYVDVEKFVEAILKMRNHNKWKFAHILKARYEKTSKEVIEAELDFLHKFDSELEVKANKLNGKVSGYILNDMRDYIIKDLETVQNSVSIG